MRRLIGLSVVLFLGLATAVSSVPVTAQVSAGDQDLLHQRLEEARAEIRRIQEQASTVAEQVASVDEQVAAVEKGLDASERLISRTRSEIGRLRQRIKAKQRVFEDVQGRATDIAISLYKAGASGPIDTLLSSKSIDELSSALEYSTVITQEQGVVMLAAKRIELELEAATAELEEKLTEAVALRREQESQAQHLRELREAKTLKLATLQKRIEGGQREAQAIVAESQKIESALAEPDVSVPEAAAPSAVGASGFAWPISGAITSGYGYRWGRMHSGIDIDCSTGAPIRASKAGSIVTATYDGSGYGYYIVIDHGGGFASLYAHMSQLYVTGGSVSQGETIGACGNTGASTGDHLHFEIRVNGSPQDPLAYLP